MSMSLKASTDGTAGEIQIGGVKKVDIGANGIPLASLDQSGSQTLPVAAATAAAHATRLDQMQYPYRNLAINGEFKISQIAEGGTTSSGTGADTYVVDQHIINAAGAAVTCGRSTDATGLPVGHNYCLKISGATSNTNIIHKHRVPARKASRLAGKTIAVSFWIYQDSGSAMSGVTVKAYCPTTTIDTFSAVTQEGSTVTLSVANAGSIARYTAIIVLGSTNPAKGLEIQIATNAALVSGKTCYLAAYQIEGIITGSIIATDFEFHNDTLNECQEYIEKSFTQGVAASTANFASRIQCNVTGGAGASIGGYNAFYIPFKKTKTGVPNVTIYSGTNTAQVRYFRATGATVDGAASTTNISDEGFNVLLNFVGSGSNSDIVHIELEYTAIYQL